MIKNIVLLSSPPPMVPVEEWGSFLIDVDGMVALIKERAYRSVLLQVPDGLRMKASELALQLSQGSGAEVMIDGESCFGACDHAGETAPLIGAEAVIQLGHLPIPAMDMSMSIPVHLFRADMRQDPEQIRKGVEKASALGLGKRVALASTVQHITALPVLRKELEERGFEVVIGPPSGREAEPGQVLGCSFGTLRTIEGPIDSVLFLGTGRFHPLGIVMATGKRTVAIDPTTGNCVLFSPSELEAFLRRRWGSMLKVREEAERGGSICIIVGTKPGQRRIRLADSILSMLTGKGIHAIKVSMSDMTPMRIRSLGFKAAVSTACPRIALDDQELYQGEGVTLLTPFEMRALVEGRGVEDYRFDDEW